MLAIPLDTKTSTTISKLFGNAPFFGLLDLQSGYCKSIENSAIGKGSEIGSFLKSSGATATIYAHMGEGVYKGCIQSNLEIFSTQTQRLCIETIYLKALANKLQKVDDSNYQSMLNSGDLHQCKCGCND